MFLQDKHPSAVGVSNPDMNAALAAFSTEGSDSGQLEFDAQAFFEEYMSTGEPGPGKFHPSKARNS